MSMLGKLKSATHAVAEGAQSGGAVASDEPNEAPANTQTMHAVDPAASRLQAIENAATEVIGALVKPASDKTPMQEVAKGGMGAWFADNWKTVALFGAVALAVYYWMKRR